MRVTNSMKDYIKATSAIVFSLELGKVRKAELEGLIETTEVEL